MRQVFAHNDADHLEAVLRASIAEGQPRTRRPWRKVLVVVEGIYSMEGEIVDLAAIVAVAKKYKVRQRCCTVQAARLVDSCKSGHVRGIGVQLPLPSTHPSSAVGMDRTRTTE